MTADGAGLGAMQRQTDQVLRELGGDYWEPLALLARLTEETGELARELNHLYGPKKKKDGEPEGSLALEIGDILYVLACLANVTGIDLDEAWTATLDKYRRRDRDRWR